MKLFKRYLFAVLILAVSFDPVFSQPLPSEDENIPFVVTFSKGASLKYGDDDFTQTFFFVIPENTTKPFFIRVFDPETSGKHDEIYGPANTKTRFSVYGGKGSYTEKDAQNENPKGNFKSGVMLTSKVFEGSTQYEDNWYVMGPFNPKEGEIRPNEPGYVFKLLIEGLEGDDGNLYKLFLSSEQNSNVKVEGANSFCYEYTFRLSEAVKSAAHIYPFVPKGVVGCKVSVFDYDDAGLIRVVSIAKKGEIFTSGTEGEWSLIEFPVVEEEINTSMDIQFINQKAVKNNNVAVYIKNQYGELMPFYTAPIGGVPKYKYKIGIKPKN